MNDVCIFDSLPTVQSAEHLVRRLARETPYVAPPQETRPLYLYGAGNLGRMAFEYCNRIGLSVAGIIDKDALRYSQDPFWADAPLMTPEAVSQDVKSDALLAVCIVSLPWGAVAAPLRASGWQRVLPFYTLCISHRDVHPLDNGWLSGALTEEDQKGLNEVLGLYADDISRAHHLQFAAWHGLQQEWIFPDAPITVDNRYFIPEILSRLHDHEFFVDLGAYHGVVCDRFINTVHGQFEGILAVEPDAGSAETLQAYIESLSPDARAKIQTEHFVLGQTEGNARFQSGLGYASRIVEQGGAPVAVHTLDSLGVTPTFMKLHLEGSELDVLLGGLETIRRCRPMIALTVYHDRMGLWPTAKRLMDELSDCGYQYHFRLHGWSGTGALLYLIPDSR
jgi:FkbM family methyltransferase